MSSIIRLRAVAMAAGCVTAFFIFASSAAASPTNLGFETGSTGTAPPLPWVVASSAEVVAITDTETAAEFPVYGDLGVSVIPHRGLQMVRLLNPRVGNEQQNRGATRLVQNYPSESTSLRFAVRLFSFEHRGDDRLNIDLIDATTGISVAGAIVGDGGSGPFVVNFVRGPAAACSVLPCSIVVDVGKSKDFLDTGWQTFAIDNLPDDGRTLKLVYEVISGNNESHPTWAYFDNVNQSPTAVIDYNPGSQGVALEGDFVFFDCDDSSDPDGDPLSCSWEITGPGVPTGTANGPFAASVFPQDGVATVTLTVSDGEATVSTTNSSIAIDNSVPLVNALNIEVLQGLSVDAMCRFADQGIDDTHTVVITVDGAGPTSQETENLPALVSGFGRATIDTTQLAAGGAPYNGVCTVTDSDGDTGTSSFTLTVIDQATLDLKESLDTGSITGAPVLTAGQIVAGQIDSDTDIDVFQLAPPGGGSYPAGSEVNVRLENLPTDFDAVLVSTSPEGLDATPFVSAPFVSVPFVSAPFVSLPFVSVPFVSLPFVSAPFVSAPFVSVPFVSAPFVSAPFVSAPFVSVPFVSSPFVSLSYEQLPLSQVGLAAPDGSNISAADIGFTDLGAFDVGDLADDPVRVKALSAEFSTNPEHMLARVGPGETVYLAVVRQSGSASRGTFSVLHEGFTPPPQDQLQGAGACTGEPLVGADTLTATTLHTPGGAPKTLIVTQRERMMATFGLSGSEFDQLIADMAPFLNHPSVLAKVISVPSDLFTVADTQPCSVAEQNNVAAEIKSIIQQELSGSDFAYVQLMGGIDIIPPYYSPDETSIGYEGLYAADLWVRQNTPLAVAIAEGNNITDAYYVDSITQLIRGRALFVEDIPVARLIETPEEILGRAMTFVANNGIISATTSLAIGYDFFKDGTAASAAILDQIATSNTVINNDDWTDDDLRCEYLGDSTCTVKDLNAINAHMSYNAALSAFGFNNGDYSAVVAATEYADLLDGKLTLSIGCHSGMNVPDAWALAEDAGMPFDPARDWVQRAGTWIGSWNFAYGDDLVSDRGTEGLMTLVIEKLGEGLSLGDALVQAKWTYSTGLFEFGVFDEKSMIALGLFGMPQATLAGGGAAAALQQVAAGNSESLVTPPTGPGELTLTVLEAGKPASTTTHTIAQVTDTPGTWFTFDDNAQAILGRPLLPVATPIEARTLPEGENPIHSIVVRGGDYHVYLDENPAFPVQKYEWLDPASIQEPQICVETLAPTHIALATRFDAPTTTIQSVIVQGGQFECTVPPELQATEPVTGNFRIWDGLLIEAMTPNADGSNDDNIPPKVITQDVVADAETGDVLATVEATDAFGLREISVLVFNDTDGEPGGDGFVQEFSTGLITTGGPQELLLPGALGKRLAFQYVDNSGNMMLKSLKGSLYLAVPVEIETSIFTTATDTDIIVNIGDFDLLDGPILTIDFGDGIQETHALKNADGSTAPGVVINTDGTATFTVSHDYSTTSDLTITVIATLEAPGANGSDTEILTRCGDPLGDALDPNGDIVACAIESSGTDVTITLYVAGQIDPGIQYRIRLPQSSKLLKYSDGKVTGPGGARLSVTPVSSDGSATQNGLAFSFRGSRVSWDGESPLEFIIQTQDGVSSGQGVGFLDEMEPFVFEP